MPQWFIRKAKAVTAKRARTVIQHILQHGHITTEQLKTLYGLHHPPRAARHVREKGIPLETFRIAGVAGKSIAAYRFADPSKIRSGLLSGRKVFSRQFKDVLIERSGCRCGICLTEYEARYLQIDHRIPYEVGGEGRGEDAPSEFQLICGSCNRAKSWSCEHCVNWTEKKQAKICRTCYWASPEHYKHLALRLVRRLAITWTGKETREFDNLAKLADQARQPVPEFVKAVLRRLGL
ncbi:MAG: HNH endonuclease [Thermoguttaceae bacterium]